LLTLDGFDAKGFIANSSQNQRTIFSTKLETGTNKTLIENMSNLKEIKAKAHDLLTRRDMKTAIDYLLTNLENVDTDLYKEALFIQTRRAVLNKDNEEQIITKEQFIVHRNRLQKSLNEFINNLDSPRHIKTHRNSLTEKQLLRAILIVQILILFGIGILIYMRVN